MTAHQKNITQRVERLRAWLREHGLYGYIFPTSDPHASEYVPDYWKSREWITGFNGSAGTAVVTLTRAALWTDSRYWLAAEDQTAGTPFEVIRCNRNQVTGDEIADWLAKDEHLSNIIDEEYIAINPWITNVDFAEELKESLYSCHTLLEDGLVFYAPSEDDDPEDGKSIFTLAYDAEADLWAERPPLPDTPVELHSLEFTGRTAQDKMNAIREAVEGDVIIITQLDEVAWTLNLRGGDVHCTPVFLAYLLVMPSEAVLYVEPHKLSAEVKAYLQEIGVRVRPYQCIARDLYTGLAGDLSLKDERLRYDPTVTNLVVKRAIEEGLYTIEPTTETSPIPLLRAIKNETEIAGFRRAMLKDGIAMVKFLRWLTSGQWTMDNGQWRMDGEIVTELTVDRKLTSLRAEQPGFRELSFDTIAAYGPHGAIVHYEATHETDVPLEPHGLLLLDSGAQYLDATTDITRTIPLGPLSDEERLDYTLVLKGHIRLATAVFPQGTTGTQLDVLARYAMWQHHKNYGHGTGHGVGSYLSVHEGPHQFRMNYVPTPLQAGMTVTIEPGIYIAGRHGVRIENTMLILPHTGLDEDSNWFHLEPLTLCPIDTSPIIRELLLPDEIEYLNNYHARVREALLPHLTDEADRQWLIAHTEAVKN